jgi:hypothetical protein
MGIIVYPSGLESTRPTAKALQQQVEEAVEPAERGAEIGMPSEAFLC